MSSDQPQRCPECGEDAVNQPPADLVPWEAHGMPRPEWSHRDGTSLCPVISPSGGYQPAQPQPRLAEPDTPTTRPEPPATLRPSMRTERTPGLPATKDPAPTARTAGALGHEHTRRVIARPGELHHQAATPPPARAGHHRADGTIRAELPADLTSARHARSAVRRALAAWGIDDPAGDAELLVSEIVSNAAEHAGGRHIGLALSRHREPGGQSGITCEVTDASPIRPRPRQAGPDEERGRGLAIVSTLATTSGVRAEPAGKTTWFTLALRDRIERAARQAEPDFEAGA